MSLSTTTDTKEVSTLTGLVHVASLTNKELFTSVTAAICKSFKNKNKKDGNNKNKKKEWQPIAIQVAIAAAKGEEGYSCANDWVNQFNILSSSSTTTTDYSDTSNFGDALKTLPARDCYRKRLVNALGALKSNNNNDANLSVKQVVGLIRGSSFITATSTSNYDTVDINKNNTSTDTRSEDVCQLQERAISQLVKIMPQLAITEPCDIFYAVQLPLLQKLDREAFEWGGINLESRYAEDEFQSLLNLKFSDQKKSKSESTVQAGIKRKLSDIDDRNIPAISGTILCLLEGAHLARNGEVRCQHGAVIYIQSQEDEEEDIQTTIIGRGWNHDFLLDPLKSKKNKIVLHSEVHAIADAIKHYGEDECFNTLFPQATIIIIELNADYTYDTCHPCPKCDPTLRAVGICNVIHTTPDGKIAELDLGASNHDLLRNENVYTPLTAAFDELSICCTRLQNVCTNANKKK